MRLLRPLIAFAAAGLVSGAGCGSRTLPVQSQDAAPGRGDARAADSAQPRKKDASQSPEACVRPAGGCFSPDDCDDGWACEGCGSDPCCPMCDVCYGTCVPYCTTNESCGDGYCQFEGGCGGEGKCASRSQICGGDCPGVCGCDGQSYCNACNAATAGVSVAHEGACDAACANKGCKVIDDCCSCGAVDSKALVEMCDLDCDRSVCSVWGITKPAGYCLLGHCLLAEAGQQCGGDHDCMVVNDCCGCAAYPRALGAKLLAQCMADCMQSACESLGLNSARARCVDGMCRLLLPIH